MEEVGLEKTTPFGKALLLGAGAFLMGLGGLAWSTGATTLRAAAVIMWLMTAAIASIVIRGGQGGPGSQRQ
jgi:hypothetical protein